MVSCHPWRQCFTLLLPASILIASGLPAWATPALTCAVPTETHTTVQEAVDDLACSSILLDAGTFPEAVTVTRPVTIQGQGVAATSVSGDGVRSVFDISGPIAVALSDMTIQDGRGSSGGGLNILNAAVNVADVRLTSHVTANGAAVYVQDGWLDLVRVTIDGNTASFAGGGIYASGSHIRLEESSLTNNEVIGGDGGALYSNGGIVTLVRTTIADNKATLGGGIYSNGSLSVSRSTLARNEGNNGGAILHYGPTTLSFSTLSHNTATFGGAVTALGDLTVIFSTLNENEAHTAGAIGMGAALTLTHSTLSNNRATIGDGGALRIGIPARYADQTTAPGSVTILNTTISGNLAAGNGGSLYHDAFDQPTRLDSSTITGNSGVNGAGLFNSNLSTISLRNSLIAGNAGSDCAGTFTSLGYNLDGDGTCSLTGPGDQPLTVPLLAPLAAGGGPTQTHALLAGSPAIDRGDPLHCPEDDQRGFARPKDGDGSDGPACDIGAYEYFVFDWIAYVPVVAR